MRWNLLTIAFLITGCFPDSRTASFAEHEKIIGTLVREKSELEIKLKQSVEDKQRLGEEFRAKIATLAGQMAQQEKSAETTVSTEQTLRRDAEERLKKCELELASIKQQIANSTTEEAQSFAQAVLLERAGKFQEALEALETYLSKFPKGSNASKAWAALEQIRSSIAFEQRIKSGDLRQNEWEELLRNLTSQQMEERLGPPSEKREIDCPESRRSRVKYTYYKYKKFCQGSDLEIAYFGDQQILLFPRKTSEWEKLLQGRSELLVRAILGEPSKEGKNQELNGIELIYEGKTLLAPRMGIVFLNGFAFAFQALI